MGKALFKVFYLGIFNRKINGWHGGNWKNSLPGKRINHIDDSNLRKERVEKLK